MHSGPDIDGKLARAIVGKKAPEGSVSIDASTARALVGQDSPVRHTIKAKLGGRQMIMSQTAADEFADATRRLAGPVERARAGRLMDRVKVVPDDPSARALGLKPSRRIKATDVRVFGTGDKLGIPTFTSDAGFVRAAADKGFQRAGAVQFDVFIHKVFSFMGH